MPRQKIDENTVRETTDYDKATVQAQLDQLLQVRTLHRQRARAQVDERFEVRINGLQVLIAEFEAAAT